MQSLCVGVVVLWCLLSSFQPVFGVKCKLCWPPMNEDQCKKQEKTLECRPWKNLGYDVCIEVEYSGNGTLARTCYPSYKCDGAKEWCRRYGPCTVKCCKGNLCNGGQPIKTNATTKTRSKPATTKTTSRPSIIICPKITCLNGGTMECTGTGQPVCRCPDGYKGDACQDASIGVSLRCYHCTGKTCETGTRTCAGNDNKCAIITTGSSTVQKHCTNQTACDTYCSAKDNCKIQCCGTDLCNQSTNVKPMLIQVVLTTLLFVTLFCQG